MKTEPCKNLAAVVIVAQDVGVSYTHIVPVLSHHRSFYLLEKRHRVSWYQWFRRHSQQRQRHLSSHGFINRNTLWYGARTSLIFINVPFWIVKWRLASPSLTKTIRPWSNGLSSTHMSSSVDDEFIQSVFELACNETKDKFVLVSPRWFLDQSPRRATGTGGGFRSSLL